MTLPVGAVGGALAQTALSTAGTLEPTGASATTRSTAAPAGLEGAFGAGEASAAAGLEGVGKATGAAVGPEGVSGVGGTSSTAGLEGTSGTQAGGFGEALTQAISSLEGSQQSADGAARALATGTAPNPESAVVTVSDAQLEMQLASQIRAKATEAAQQIFQTQV